MPRPDGADPQGDHVDEKNQARLEHAREFAAWQSDQAYQGKPHDIEAYEAVLRSDEAQRNAEIVEGLRALVERSDLAEVDLARRVRQALAQ